MEGRPIARLTAAWHEREIAVPVEWTGRRIALSAEYLNSFAAVFVEGRKAGELHQPEEWDDPYRFFRW